MGVQTDSSHKTIEPAAQLRGREPLIFFGAVAQTHYASGAVEVSWPTSFCQPTAL